MCTKFEKKNTDPFLSYQEHKEISTVVDLNRVHLRLLSGDIIKQHTFKEAFYLL